MRSLCIRTDRPIAELHIVSDGKKQASLEWEGHRQLAETIHIKIRELLGQADMQMSDIDKVVVFKGPGSFTGLRIGISVANALAYGLEIPVVGSKGDDWITAGAEAATNGRSVVPEYGADPHITQQKK